MFREGRAFTFYPLKIYYLTIITGEHFLQAGFGVSVKNFKKAVDRNRVKRLMKEAYRVQKTELQDTLTFKNIHLALFCIYTARDMPEHTIVTSKISLALKRLQKQIDENDPGSA